MKVAKYPALTRMALGVAALFVLAGAEGEGCDTVNIEPGANSATKECPANTRAELVCEEDREDRDEEDRDEEDRCEEDRCEEDRDEEDEGCRYVCVPNR